MWTDRQSFVRSDQEYMHMQCMQVRASNETACRHAETTKACEVPIQRIERYMSEFICKNARVSVEYNMMTEPQHAQLPERHKPIAILEVFVVQNGTQTPTPSVRT
jgi:hypothetical protein